MTGWILLLGLACGASPAEPSTSVPGAPHAPLPPDDVVQAMQAQAVLEHPEVEAFLHLDVPGHLPLKVHSVDALAAGASSLVAGGQAVQVVATPPEARVQLLGREALDGPRVRIRLAIPAEGVAGHVDVALADHVWSAVGASLAEQ
jgi:hypothetical protein